MKATILFFLFIQLIVAAGYAAPGDTTRIQVHNAVDMVWYENYDRPVSFPNTGATYSKILMHYTMGCASTGCSDWDYTTKIELRNPLGYMDSTIASIDTISVSPLEVDTVWSVFEAKESFELARVITPYGGYMRTGSNGYAPNWKHVHTFDVTDYAPLFHGNKEIRAFYGGWSSGFSVTIEFEFIEGIPPREVLEVRNLWQTGRDGWTYQNQTAFEQTYLHQLPVDFPENMKEAKLRFIPSGHGFDNNTGCAEFCEKNYYLKLDGTQIGSNLMWDSECGSNPIYPQGGTWLYDRANWCPGSRVHHFDHELTGLVTAGNTHDLDIDIQAISWFGTQAPVYILETQLFIYGEKSFQHDAAIEDILSPSLKDDYKRLNPVCNHATVKIKNYGSEELTSAVIKYAVNGNHWRTYQWQGNLAFDETEIVTLPLTETWEWGGVGSVSEFTAKIEQPNGQQDENSTNNSMSSGFTTTPMISSPIELHFKTNSQPAQTTWKLFDSDGTIIRQNGSMTANKIYRDTFELDPGCYLLKIEDSAENGLSWWANNEGSGFARLVIPGGGGNAHLFEPDFGTSIEYYFTVGYTLGINTDFKKLEQQVMVFPNPNNGEFTILMDGFENEELTIEITNVLGQVINREITKIKGSTSVEKKYDLSDQGAGYYFVHITSGDKKITKKISKQ